MPGFWLCAPVLPTAVLSAFPKAVVQWEGAGVPEGTGPRPPAQSRRLRAGQRSPRPTPCTVKPKCQAKIFFCSIYFKSNRSSSPFHCFFYSSLHGLMALTLNAWLQS